MPPEPNHRGPISLLGNKFLDGAEYIGGMWLLLVQALRWMTLGVITRRAKFGWGALATQMVRVGVNSVAIVALVQFFIGVILALQLAPQFANFQMLQWLAYTIGYTVFRELGPLLSAVVLSGFAGASIAAEIGTMVVGEEVEALNAHAINPVRFLVVPRVLATTVMLVCLCVVADLAAALGGYVTSLAVLGPDAYQNWWSSMRDQLKYVDFFTGLIKAGVFGLCISLIACYEGLKVRGGAEGVGKATTMTVVYSIVSLIGVDCIFTVVFYALKL